MIYLASRLASDPQACHLVRVITQNELCEAYFELTRLWLICISFFEITSWHLSCRDYARTKRKWADVLVTIFSLQWIELLKDAWVETRIVLEVLKVNVWDSSSCRDYIHSNPAEAKQHKGHWWSLGDYDFRIKYSIALGYMFVLAYSWNSMHITRGSDWLYLRSQSTPFCGSAVRPNKLRNRRDITLQFFMQREDCVTEMPWCFHGLISHSYLISTTKFPTFPENPWLQWG